MINGRTISTRGFRWKLMADVLWPLNVSCKKASQTTLRRIFLAVDRCIERLLFWKTNMATIELTAIEANSKNAKPSRLRTISRGITRRQKRSSYSIYLPKDDKWISAPYESTVFWMRMFWPLWYDFIRCPWFCAVTECEWCTTVNNMFAYFVCTLCTYIFVVDI